MPRHIAVAFALLFALLVACGSGGSSKGQSAVTPVATEAPATVTATVAASPTATPAPIRLEIKPSRLQIPALSIDVPVQASQTVPDTSTPPTGCTPREPGGETLTVPSSGVASPGTSLDGLENKTWIFGHSRYLSAPGVFLSLQDINLGDELFLDGTNRATGAPVSHERFVVNGIFLTDTDSGGTLLNADKPSDIPKKPMVLLQTSVREDGPGKQWILNQQKLLSKATNLVQGNLDDMCKYLLLFVVAQPS